MSVFNEERSNVAFEIRILQYCSSCTLDSSTGTQYSLNLGGSDFHPKTTYRENISFKLLKFSRELFREGSRLSNPPSESSRDKELEYSAVLSCHIG